MLKYRYLTTMLRQNHMRLVVIISFTIICCVSFAQDETTQVYQKGDHVLHLGIGYPNIAAGAVAGLNALPSSIIGQVIVQKGKAGPQYNMAYDYGLTEEISAGFYYGHSAATSPTIFWDNDTINLLFLTIPAATGEFSYKVQIHSFGVKAVYHFTELKLKNLDVYGVGFLGVNLVKIEEKGNLPEENIISTASQLLGIGNGEVIPIPTTNMNIAGNIGIRYFFNNNMGFYIEAGYGGNLVNLGYTWKFASKS